MRGVVLSLVLTAASVAAHPADEVIASGLNRLDGTKPRPKYDGAWRSLNLPAPEEVLYESWHRTKSVSAVQEEVGRVYSLPPEGARHFLAAKATVTALRLWDCRKPEDAQRAQQTFALAKEAVQQSDGAVTALALLTEFDVRRCSGDAEEGVFRDAIANSSDPVSRALSALRVHTSSFDVHRMWLTKLVLERQPERVGEVREANGADQTDLEMTAVYLHALDAAGPGSVPYAERLVRNLIHEGLPTLALQTFDALPKDLRKELVSGRTELLDDEGRPEPDLRLELAAARFVTGNVKAARALLARVPPRQDRCWPALQRNLLRFATGEKVDTFANFVAHQSCRLVFGRTWVILLSRGTGGRNPSWLRDVLESSVEFLEESNLDRQLQRLDLPAFQRSVARIHEAARKDREPLRAELAKLEKPAVSSRPDVMAEVTSRGIDALPSAPEAKPLPPPGEWRGQRGVEMSVPVAPTGFWMVRAEAFGERVIGIALSQDVDPTGEATAGGYWVLESKNGKTWSSLLYTGLREARPYVVSKYSDLPFLDGETLQVEVAVKEIDESTISIPPYRTKFARQQSGLYLQLSLDELRRDSDGDGLTDVFERRLLLDPEKSDTDGDGIPDGSDALANVPTTKGKKSPTSEVIEATVAKLFDSRLDPGIIVPIAGDGSKSGVIRQLGSDQLSRVVFVKGARADFATVDSSQRLVVITEDELKRAREKVGAFYPLSIRVHLSDAATEAYVDWDEGYRGGSFKAVKKHGRWELTSNGTWIS